MLREDKRYHLAAHWQSKGLQYDDYCYDSADIGAGSTIALVCQQVNGFPEDSVAAENSIKVALTVEP